MTIELFWLRHCQTSALRDIMMSTKLRKYTSLSLVVLVMTRKNSLWNGGNPGKIILWILVLMIYVPVSLIMGLRHCSISWKSILSNI